MAAVLITALALGLVRIHVRVIPATLHPALHALQSTTVSLTTADAVRIAKIQALEQTRAHATQAIVAPDHHALRSTTA